MPPRRASRGPDSKGKPPSSASASAAAPGSSAPLSRKRSISGGAPGGSPDKPEAKRVRTSSSIGGKPVSSKSAKENGIISAEKMDGVLTAVVEEQEEEEVKPVKAKAAARGPIAGLRASANKSSSARTSASTRARGGKGAAKFVTLPLPKHAEHIRPGRTLLAWGCGDAGELGLHPKPNDEVEFPRASAWMKQAIEGGKFGEPGAGLEDVEAGGMHSLAVDEEGRIWSWGVNDEGALGRITSGVVDPATGAPVDNTDLEAVPAPIQALADEKFRAVKVAASDSASITVSDKGEIRCWGTFRGNDGDLGFAGVRKVRQYEPVALDFPTGIARRLRNSRPMEFAQVAAGVDHLLALTTEGNVYTLGDSLRGQLGRDVESSSPDDLTKSTIPGKTKLNHIIKIAAGRYQSFAIDVEGRVFAWGFNALGQCGLPLGETPNVEEPTEIPSLSPKENNGAKVVAVAAGELHSLFLFDNGSLYGCGQLPDSGKEDKNDRVIGVADDHPCRTDPSRSEEEKEKKCICKPVQIFFPPPPTEDEEKPEVPPFEDSQAYRTASSRVIDVAVGERHSVAITREGNLYSWGIGENNQLGLGEDVTEVTVPTLVTSKVLSMCNPLKVTVGAQFSLALVQKK